MQVTRTTTTPTGALSTTNATIYSNTEKDLVRNEIIIGGGITLLGGLIGLGLGVWSNNRNKRSGAVATRTDLEAAFEGALFGLIIALISVLLYRAFFHGQTLYHAARANQQAAVSRYQQAQLQSYSQIGAAAPAVSTAGLQTAARVGVIRPIPNL